MSSQWIPRSLNGFDDSLGGMSVSGILEFRQVEFCVEDEEEEYSGNDSEQSFYYRIQLSYIKLFRNDGENL
ncbi:MAG: hypothetical protein EZS28_018802 [Streblomastix strix]|uniref:Uncharacterized protein n=1 Tax=Streblomastix strix TaxID=222440 RepID=A0A5J4VT87_9EUKA|nr:MAG: hypothetical protein EZS28_018802 [Streblomastix strix]